MVLEKNYALWLEKYWMTITAGDETKANTMTAAWGSFGVMWNKACAWVAVRPQRYTYEFLCEKEVFSLNFFEEKDKEKLAYLGSVSGRDEDKIRKMDLQLGFYETIPYLVQAKHQLFCKKIYLQRLEKNCFLEKHILDTVYPKDDFHWIFIGEILGDESLVVK